MFFLWWISISSPHIKKKSITQRRRAAKTSQRKAKLLQAKTFDLDFLCVFFAPSRLCVRFFVFSKQLFFFEFLKTGFGEQLQLAEKLFIDRGEIKTRLALHSFLKLGRYAFQQLRKHIDRKKILAHIVFLDLRRAEEKLFLYFSE